MTLRFAALAFLLVSLINIVPLLVANVGGDIDFHLAMIKCFAGQFWQGDMYPRWCMDANAGLGSPAPLFYFPLPYYAAVPLYPLTHLGVSIHGIYVLSLFLATVATGLTCYFWLKDIVSPERALLVSMLFLFLPYRMEAMLFRSGYAELWGMALLPLVFKYIRRLAQNDRDALLPLAAAFGLLFIVHLPDAAVAAMFGGVYLFIMTRASWRPKIRYGISILWALALAAFYVVPAIYYKHFIAELPLPEGAYGWPNTYVRIYNFTVLGQKRQLILIALMILSLAVLSVAAFRKRMAVPDPFVRQEIIAWGVLSALALFLLFPISAPFYALIGPLTEVLFPWRMQSIFMLALAFFLAVWMQWFMSERRMKTWQGDYTILLAFLALTAYFSLGVREDAGQALSEKIRPMMPILPEEYRTDWMDVRHFGLKYFFSRYEHKDSIKPAEIISGKGIVAVEHWAWDGITLRSQSAHGMTARLDHIYFPVWSARADDGEPVTLRPEPATGQMLLDIPAGRHRVRLHYDIATSQPWLVWLADAASALAALAWLVVMYRRRPVI